MGMFIIVKTLKEKRMYCHGDQKKIAAQHNVSETTIRGVEKDAKEYFERGVLPDYTPKKKGRCGTKSQYSGSVIAEILEKAHVNLRNSCHAVAALLGVSHTTVLRWTRGNNPKIKVKNVHVCPLLNFGHYKRRVEFICSKITLASSPCSIPTLMPVPTPTVPFLSHSTKRFILTKNTSICIK
jgi:DNA-binding XRE family transcriptional regulator